jgi:hypothetical protein
MTYVQGGQASLFGGVHGRTGLGLTTATEGCSPEQLAMCQKTWGDARSIEFVALHRASQPQWLLCQILMRRRINGTPGPPGVVPRPGAAWRMGGSRT